MSDGPHVQVRVSRRFDAPPERVFDAWLDPETARRFLFATETGEIVRLQIEPREGGQYSIVDRRDGQDVEHRGEYLEIDRPRRLVFTLQAPFYSEDVDRIAIDVASVGAGCELTLLHETAPEWADRVEDGWNPIFDSLEEVLA